MKEIPYREFACPRCGAPGCVRYGQAEYTCLCRHGTYSKPLEASWPKCATCGHDIFFGHQCNAVNGSQS